jgi:hypothetical protein
LIGVRSRNDQQLGIGHGHGLTGTSNGQRVPIAGAFTGLRE